MKNLSTISIAASISVILIFASSNVSATSEIVHDAEFYVLKAQYGKQWDAEDKELKKKLAALKEKYGTPPNIVHIMWDDTPTGEVGFPALQKLRGFETPNINKMAAEGANFLRMYTEPSCTQSRAAVITGRHSVRSGMTQVGFPYEYGGLAKEEVTMAGVLERLGMPRLFTANRTWETSSKAI